MIRPTLQSRNISNTKLEVYATNILKEMTANKDLFVDPNPSLEDFRKVLFEFIRATAEAAHRDMRAVILRNQKRAELQHYIRLMSFYVASIANGDEGIILAAGFVPSKKVVNSESLHNPKPENLRAKATIGSGSIDLVVKPWRSARMYQFEYRKKGTDDPWTVRMSSNSRCRITDLEVFGEYEFRVSYLGRSGKLLYSDVVSCYVY